ncbi:MAG: hypothetical protein ACJA0Q_001318 [Saprospiraceae bacterium]|jgi:hypothetical protein
MSKISSIKFQSKEESNQEQQAAFLALSPVERFYRFLELMVQMKNFPQKESIENTDSFKIVINQREDNE